MNGYLDKFEKKILYTEFTIQALIIHAFLNCEICN